LKFHAYAIGALALIWFIDLLSVQIHKESGLDGLGQGLILFALTLFFFAHSFVSSIAVFLMRNVRRGVLYAHGAALALEIAALTTLSALG
jgi:hypothetical protein